VGTSGGQNRGLQTGHGHLSGDQSFNRNITDMGPPKDRRPSPPGAIRTRCDIGNHESCGHQHGLGGTFPLFGRPQSMVLLCPCTCHVGCPVTRRQDQRGSVLQDDWLNECDCAGAEEKKARIRAMPRHDERPNPLSAPKRMLALIGLGVAIHHIERTQTKKKRGAKGGLAQREIQRNPRPCHRSSHGWARGRGCGCRADGSDGKAPTRRRRRRTRSLH